jgi:DNA repair photolyase
MILSVSRRTDIPAFYSKWFFQRVKEGFVMARNPMNIHYISKISINKDIVDCIVFWTKDPSNMIPDLKKLGEIPYYFQFTLNPYSDDLEKYVPKKKYLVEIFKRLSDIISPKRIIWRYDPILLTNKINIEYHTKYFEELAKRISGFSNICTLSFLDNYKRIEKNLKAFKVRDLTTDDVNILSSRIALIAKNYSFNVITCAEKYDLSRYGIKHGRCIDSKLIEEIIGKKLFIKKDKNQRKECGCVESVDIGEYNSCNHNCIYCYANYNIKSVKKKTLEHNPFSPIQIGEICNKDIIRTKTTLSNTIDNQLFDK